MRTIPAALGAACAATTLLISAGICTAQDNLVQNGSFEAGDFVDWNVPPNAPPPFGALFFVSDEGGYDGPNYAHLSSFNLQFMSQFLPDTVAGTDYELSFWLRKPSNAPSSLTVRWEGQDVLYTPFQLPTGSAWYEFTVPLHANFSGSFLEFGQAFFPLEYHIDDISVVQVPGPTSTAPLALASTVVLCRRRR